MLEEKVIEDNFEVYIFFGIRTVHGGHRLSRPHDLPCLLVDVCGQAEDLWVLMLIKETSKWIFGQLDVRQIFVLNKMMAHEHQKSENTILLTTWRTSSR